MSAHHGNTPAAWAAVTVVLLGFVLGGLALVISNWPLFWIGCALGPIGGVVGMVMSKMGMGAEPVSR